MGGGVGLRRGDAPSRRAGSAEERVCRGTIGAATVDNLRVPQGATCTLNGTRVKGTVKVERDATLRAFGVRVIGNVQAENARNVVVREGSRVGGSVQIVQGGAARVLGNRINGDILFDEQDRRAHGEPQRHRRQPPGVPEHRRPGDPEQPDRRQPPVQGEPSGTDRRRQRRPGQQGGSVPSGCTRRHAEPICRADGRSPGSRSGERPSRLRREKTESRRGESNP